MRVILNALQAGNRSGTGRYAQALARWIPDVSVDIELVVVWPEGLPTPVESKAEFHTINLGGAGARILADQWGMETIRRRYGAEFVHYPANIGGCFRACPQAVTIHDLSYFVNPKWFRAVNGAYYRWGSRVSAQRAKLVIADSTATASDLDRYLGIGADHVAVIPLGVDERFKPPDVASIAHVRSTYKLPDRFILYMGTIEPRKNLVRLVQAFDRFAREWDGDLVIAGRRGWKTEAIDAAVAQSGCADRIHFPGFIAEDDQAAVYGAAHAFAWPSVYEGFGLPPLEAMACGAPVLTSDVSSLPEAVGDAAITLDPEDIDAIANGLNAIAKDETRRADLRKRGFARAAEATWKKTAEATAAAYLRTAE